MLSSNPWSFHEKKVVLCYSSTISEQLLIDTFKYLGILLGCDVSWSPHIAAVCSKARQVIGLLYRRFYPVADTHTLIRLYTSLVQPHLEHGYPVWAPYTHRDTEALESVQKFACSMATHCWRSSYEELLALTDMPTLERRRLHLKLGHLFKVVHHQSFFPNGIISLRQHSQYNSRSLH